MRRRVLAAAVIVVALVAADLSRPPDQQLTARGRTRRHPRLPGDAVAGLRGVGRGLPLRPDVQSLRRGGACGASVWCAAAGMAPARVLRCGPWTAARHGRSAATRRLTRRHAATRDRRATACDAGGRAGTPAGRRCAAAPSRRSAPSAVPNGSSGRLPIASPSASSRERGPCLPAPVPPTRAAPPRRARRRASDAHGHGGDVRRRRSTRSRPARTRGRSPRRRRSAPGAAAPTMTNTAPHTR